MKKSLLIVSILLFIGCSSYNEILLKIHKPNNLLIIGNNHDNYDSVCIDITLSFDIINKTNKELGNPIIYVSDPKKVYTEGGDFIYFQDSTFYFKELSNMASIIVNANKTTECYLGIHKFNLSKERLIELNPQFKDALSQKKLKEPLYWYTEVNKLLELPDIAEKMKNVNDSIHVIFFRKQKYFFKKRYNNIILKEKINYN